MTIPIKCDKFIFNPYSITPHCISTNNILIQFNNPCIFLSNTAYTNAIIVIFNNNPFEYQIGTKCVDNSNSMIIYETMRVDNHNFIFNGTKNYSYFGYSRNESYNTYNLY